MRRRRRRPLDLVVAIVELRQPTKSRHKKCPLASNTSLSIRHKSRTKELPFVFVLFLIVMIAQIALQLFPSYRSPPFANSLATTKLPLNSSDNLASSTTTTTGPPASAITTVATSSHLQKTNKSSQRKGSEVQRRRKEQIVKQKIGSTAQVVSNQQASSDQTRQRAKGNGWRAKSTFRGQQESGDFQPTILSNESNEPIDQHRQPDSGQLQVSITPRVSLVRVPVESNAILKCLISSQTNKFTRPFRIRWSRFMYDENVYEQIESSTGFEETDQVMSANNTLNQQVGSKRSGRQTDGQPQVVSIVNRQQQLRDFLQRSRQETNVINDLLIEATISISPVKASDNASYYCSASDIGKSIGANERDGSQQRARIDLLVLSRPIVKLERVQTARDSRSALIFWSIENDGNTPIKKTILMVRNDSQHHSYASQEFEAERQMNLFNSTSTVITDQDHQQWQKIDILGDGELVTDPIGGTTFELFPATSSGSSDSVAFNAKPLFRSDDSDVVRASLDADITSIGQQQQQQWNNGTNWLAGSPGGQHSKLQLRAYNLTGLLPGVTYQFKLAAINDMGQSSWSQLEATMPNEIPAQIQDIVVLSTSNDPITIGWRRPPWDGAKTIRYEMQLFDLNRTLTLDANTNTTGQQLRTNYMFHFVNLQPGTDYHFHIRACSRAGCSAYSNPKLLASTLDGEPDEPQEVELQCSTNDQQPTAMVSWLPPREVRGKLLNYSVKFESFARYRNQSGLWTTEEWQTTIETSDNHTLSLELGNPNSSYSMAYNASQLSTSSLLPNTNYSVRVCANNRSKNCGKLSAITPRSQCFIPGQLPRELPMGEMQLSLRKFDTNSLNEQQQFQQANSEEQNQIETLHLELPFLSWRNGSIDCIQVILIKLHESFDGAARSRPLSDFLPDDPAEIRLHEYIDLVTKVRGKQRSGEDFEGEHQEGKGEDNWTAERKNKQPSKEQFSNDFYRQKRAFAYLAEELDALALWPSGLSEEERESGRRRIVLGDGRQSNCRSVWMQTKRKKARNVILDEAKQRTSLDGSNKDAGFEAKQLQPLDGSLAENTYYTGFLRLIQLRKHSPKRHTLRFERRQSEMQDESLIMDNIELATKYSYYFSPIKTGKRVPEVPIESLLSQQLLASSNQSRPFELSLCRSQFVIDLQSKLFGSTKACRMLGETMETVRRNVINLFRSLVGSFSSTGITNGNAQNNSLARLLQNSAAEGPTQVLQVGLIVIILSLFLLFVVYLFTLPAAIRRRQKQGKMRKQLEEHEATARQQSSKHSASIYADETGGFGQREQQLVRSSDGETVEVGTVAECQLIDSFKQSADQQQVLNQPVECPIHTSPIGQQPANNVHSATMKPSSRRQSIHACQAQQQQQQSEVQQQMAYNTMQHRQASNLSHHHHHRQNHQYQATQSQYQLNSQQQNQEQSNQLIDYSRNCRTMRPSEQHSSALMNSANLYDQRTQQQQQQQQMHYQQRHVAMTLQHGTGSGSLAATVLALAKKINKSIPLALFHSVLDIRLRNNWLREEYEQLPRAASSETMQRQNGANGDGAHEGRHIRLRPQLIVSRDDSISALISGNEFYDGSLVRFQQRSATGASDQKCPIERQFICAKSPLDADSVWDFWRLIYELEVSVLVMLTPNEDVHTGELRCAQYWPTCDNEETTILSPCNEHVQSSTILPAKFKIRQETLNSFDDMDEQRQFKVRRLTFLVMASKLSENEHILASSSATTNETLEGPIETDGAQRVHNSNGLKSAGEDGRANGKGLAGGEDEETEKNKGNNDNIKDEDEDDEEKLVIVERTLLHFQFLHWNASSSSNQAKLIKFVEFVNERHSRQLQQLVSPGANWQQVGSRSPILVHCANGLGRSGLFAAMSYVVDDLRYKLSQHQQLIKSQNTAIVEQQSQQQSLPKINLFQLVTKLRSQRDMLLSPYRFYELLYQLTARYIPVQQQQLQ